MTLAISSEFFEQRYSTSVKIVAVCPGQSLATSAKLILRLKPNSWKAVGCDNSNLSCRF